MINGIVFDMDGLMFDTERIAVQAYDYAGEKMGFGKTGYMVMKTLGINKKGSHEIWAKEFGDRFNSADLEKYSLEYFDDFYKNNKVPVKKGLYDLLDYLRENNYKMAVASSSSQKSVIHHLKDAGIYEYFSVIVCGDMIEKSKPDPEIYLRACELLEEDPSNCIALEDSRNGILAATSAGCKTIMIPDLWQGDEEIDSKLFNKVESLDQVIKILE